MVDGNPGIILKHPGRSSLKAGGWDLELVGFPFKKNIIDSELMVYNDCTMMITDGLMKV